MRKFSNSSVSLAKCSVYFWPGSLDVGFVLSAPGTHEADQLVPLAGSTGVHLDMALTRHLMPALPEAFPSGKRYDYRITNAHTTPLSHALGHGRTEADDGVIRTLTNSDRVRAEMAGCRLVILCGAKAQLLKGQLRGFALVEAGHVSMNGLNTRWPESRMHVLDPAWDSKTGEQRTAARIALWSADVVGQVRALIKTGAFKK